MGGANYWLLGVDQETRFERREFLKKKDEVSTKVENFIADIRRVGKEIKFIISDALGENKTLRDKLKENERQYSPIKL